MRQPLLVYLTFVRGWLPIERSLYGLLINLLWIDRSEAALSSVLKWKLILDGYVLDWKFILDSYSLVLWWLLLLVFGDNSLS